MLSSTNTIWYTHGGGMHFISRTDQFHFLREIQSSGSRIIPSKSGYFKDVVVVAPLTESPPLINGEIAFRPGILWLLGGEGETRGQRTLL